MTKDRKPSRMVRISQAADVELEAAKDLIEQLRPLDDRPSGSVAIEFMAHILKHAFEAGAIGDMPRFKQKTSPRSTSDQLAARPPSPKAMREAAGLVSPVQRRKL